MFSVFSLLLLSNAGYKVLRKLFSMKWEQCEGENFVTCLCDDVLLEVLLFGQRRQLALFEKFGRRFNRLIDKSQAPFLPFTITFYYRQVVQFFSHKRVLKSDLILCKKVLENRRKFELCSIKNKKCFLNCFIQTIGFLFSCQRSILFFLLVLFYIYISISKPPPPFFNVLLTPVDKASFKLVHPKTF